jgi:hypothetical protein
VDSCWNELIRQQVQHVDSHDAYLVERAIFWLWRFLVVTLGMSRWVSLFPSVKRVWSCGSHRMLCQAQWSSL